MNDLGERIQADNQKIVGAIRDLSRCIDVEMNTFFRYQDEVSRKLDVLLGGQFQGPSGIVNQRACGALSNYSGRASDGRSGFRRVVPVKIGQSRQTANFIPLTIRPAALVSGDVTGQSACPCPGIIT